MKFRVWRTSGGMEGQACPEAREEAYTLTQAYPADQRMAGGYQHGQPLRDSPQWREEGTNHREEDGQIKRDLMLTGWFIELDTLEALLAFTATYGQCIVSQAGFNGFPTLEIYDDYKE